MLRALYLLNTDAYNKIYGAPEREAIASLVEIVAPQQTAESGACTRRHSPRSTRSSPVGV